MEPDQLYQNERFFGLVWKASTATLDRGEWTDAEGAVVVLSSTPSQAPGEWEVVVTTATDKDGWQYATVFK